jgi:hypothetical protein
MLMHSACPANPPLKLLVTQIVSFSSKAYEFSAAFLVSANSTDSRTEIRPEIVNVLFFVALANAPWTASAHSQQLVWQIWVKAVSGTALKLCTCDASALYSTLEESPACRGGSTLKLHGQTGSPPRGGVDTGGSLTMQLKLGCSAWLSA